MTTFVFATCERGRALGFLRDLYPGCRVEDEGAVKELLDLVEADVCRVQDPSMHKPAAIVLGRSGTPEDVDRIHAAALAAHTAMLAEPKP